MVEPDEALATDASGAGIASVGTRGRRLTFAFNLQLLLRELMQLTATKRQIFAGASFCIRAPQPPTLTSNVDAGLAASESRLT